MAFVLVIEDEADTGDYLDSLLRHFGYDVLRAATGAAGISTSHDQHPDIVLLDLGLPDMTGIDVVRAIRAESGVPILVLSGTNRRHSRADALDAGADDFVAKPFDVRELGARLRAVSRRTTTPDSGAPSVRSFGPLLVDTDHRAAALGGDEVRLTAIEWKLLEALTRHPGRLVTHRWLIAQVWSSAHGAESVTSLRAHVRALRSKLGDDATAPRFLRTESGIGYRWIAVHLSVTHPGEDQAHAQHTLTRLDELRRFVQDRGADPRVLDSVDYLVEQALIAVQPVQVPPS